MKCFLCLGNQRNIHVICLKKKILYQLSFLFYVLPLCLYLLNWVFRYSLFAVVVFLPNSRVLHRFSFYTGILFWTGGGLRQILCPMNPHCNLCSETGTAVLSFVF